MNSENTLSPHEKSGEDIPVTHDQPPPVQPPKRRSFLRWLFSPFILVFVIIMVVFLALMFGRYWYDSLLARLEHRQIAHPDDHPVVDNGIRPQVRPTVTLIYKNQEGKPVRVIADAEAYSEFVNQQVAHLEPARMQLLAHSQTHLHDALNEVFQEMQLRIEHFADWYFAYTTTYKLLWEATTSASGHVLSFNTDNLADAVASDMEKYLYQHYEDIVLRPATTNPQLRAVYKNTLKFIHDQYLEVLSTMQADFQTFVAKYTTHLEKPSGKNTELVFDWESQFNKINLAEYEKGPQGAAFGAALMAGGAATGKVVAGAAGKAVTGKAIAGATSQAVFAKLSAPFVSKAVLAAAGGALGTVGGPLGIALGALGGLGIDYMLSEGVELTQRETFVSDVKGELNTTQVQWEKEMSQSLNEVVDIWMEDTIQLLPHYQET